MIIFFHTVVCILKVNVRLLHLFCLFQPTDGVGSILLGTALTPEEAEALQKKKQNSELKMKEMSGSGIFNLDNDDANAPQSIEKPKVRPQPACEVSHILFGEVETISPRKPTSIPEVAKLRELSGTLEAPVEETSSRKPTSTSKVKELVGSDIFGPPPEVTPRSRQRIQDNGDVVTPLRDLSLNPPRVTGTLAFFGDNVEQEASAKKCNVHKVAELSGHNIFTEDSPQTASSEKSLSAAKRKEITGSNIFADEKPVLREHYGGIRKPPGGGSSITLV
ncbi:hypothetical protein KP509_03G036400 [Ceratopteris richardii]|uniref:DUF4057 domain-containing protein n=1 Tax=Ceratopteris richardii TaxID=49495 RepID=A0A8T2UYY8_CERRI|nr:hypothetical protein KP509_03G036400 [Ceratopteris richardii]